MHIFCSSDAALCQITLATYLLGVLVSPGWHKEALLIASGVSQSIKKGQDLCMIFPDEDQHYEFSSVH